MTVNQAQLIDFLDDLGIFVNRELERCTGDYKLSTKAEKISTLQLCS